MPFVSYLDVPDIVTEQTAKVSDWIETNGKKFDEWTDKKFSEGKPEEFFKSFPELTKDAGLSSECYKTETEDGYILNMFRVKDESTTADAPVVFL